MTASRSLTLVIPGLLDAVRSPPQAADSAAPALARLLALSRGPTVRNDEDPVAIACAALGIERQRDWPVAPWLARGAGLPVADSYWLCADPVNLVIHRDDVRINRVVSDLTIDEAGALIATLDAHFCADEVGFRAPQAARWLVQTEEPQAISTWSAEAALRGSILGYLPQGPAATTWRRWQSEVQMLFHEHAVNRARAAAGLDVVNSVWFWGGGVFAGEAVHPSVDSVYSGISWLAELAAAGNVVARSTPASFAAFRGSGSASALVWLDPMSADDLGADIVALDGAWGRPLYDALQSNILGMLDIIVTGHSRILSFSPRRPTLTTRIKTALAPPRLSALLGCAADR